MIVIRVEMWPHGNKEKAILLGCAEIVNTGKGDATWGQYRSEFVNHGGSHGPETWRRSEVKNHERNEESFWILIMKAIAAAF